MRRTLIAMAASIGALVAAEPKLEFNRDVRPILSDKCFQCHGPDAKNKGVPTRLDVEADAKKRTIVPGDPAASRLIQRITAEKKPLRMPPVHTGMLLTEAEIETLKTWIAQGAEWQPHWSFIPPVKKAPPVDVAAKAPTNGKEPSASGNAIDGFILARLRKDGLTLSPAASKETLIRRLSFDLNGLPPTPTEVDAFVNDKRADAYERLVDRLLASPRYGERMAARWLDAARYADTNGYQYDGERVMWRWRDYVIESFNKNKPFDQFTVEQIAGDMLPNATFEQRLGTGFNRNHRGNTEDGIVPEEYAVEYVVDRVETTSAVFMGMTMGCARCHNHKYDPFTAKEFYQFFAYFNNVPELGRAMKYGNSPPLIPAPTQKQQKELADLDGRIQGIERTLAGRSKELAAARAVWEKSLGSQPPAHWTPQGMRNAEFSFDDGDVDGRFGKARKFDGSAAHPGGEAAQFDIEDPWAVSLWVNTDAMSGGTLLSRLAKDEPKARGYGLHIAEGKVFFHITSQWDSDALRVTTEQPLPAGGWRHIALTYSGSRMAEGVRIYIDGKPMKLKVDSDTLYRPFRNAGGKFDAKFLLGGGAGAAKRFRGSMDDVRIYSRVLKQEEVEMLAAGQTIQAIASMPRAGRAPVLQRQLELHYLETAAHSDVRKIWAGLEALRDERERFVRTFPTVMVMAEAETPKKTHLLLRGAYDKPGEEVQPGLPAVLPPLPAGAPNNRLGLAKWLVDKENPLTARVTVNRFWQMLFGVGLVKTAEDFGQQGEWPSHPELLDWLAVDFVENGWDVKAILKKIVMSDTYRQSSKASPELLHKDPENRLLARGPRYRLPAEVVRDASLYEAGLLVEKLGGPSVKPYQPDGLWKEVIMQDMDYVQSKGPDLYRRGLYTFWKRTAAPPMMMNFDASQREACVVRENRTNTPLQALNLMNDVTFLEAARFIGQRMLLEGGASPDDRLRYGYRLVTSRAPNPTELGVLRGSLAYHRDYFASRPGEIAKYLSQGDSPSNPKLDRGELAAYMSVASLLLNTDEAITKE